MSKMGELYEETRQEQEDFLYSMHEQQAMEEVAKACANDAKTFESFLRLMWENKQ